MAETESKTKSFLAPIVGGVILIVAVVGLIAFRNQLGDLIASSSKQGSQAVIDWVPNHPSETLAIVVGFLVAFGINWIAHVVGRLRAWMFAIVVEAGLWFLFWNSIGVIPSLKELFGISDDVALSGNEQVVTLVIVIVLSGVIFWILEMRENWAKYRRRHNEEG